jgi:hypothetical protein
MKNIIMVIFLLVRENLFSIELWNGFTTNMSENDIIIRANEIFELKYSPRERDRKLYPLDILPTGRINYNLINTSSMKVLQIILNSNNISDINYFIYNDKLFSIVIRWYNIQQNVLIQRARQQYGDNKILNYILYFSDPPRDIPMWNLQGFDFFIWNTDFIYIDKLTNNKYFEEKKILEQNEKNEQERRMKETSSNIIF